PTSVPGSVGRRPTRAHLRRFVGGASMAPPTPPRRRVARAKPALEAEHHSRQSVLFRGDGRRKRRRGVCTAGLRALTRGSSAFERRPSQRNGSRGRFGGGGCPFPRRT